MKYSILLFALLISSAFFSSCKKKTEDAEVTPLQNVRFKKDGRYYYHYDTEGRITAKDLKINDVVAPYYEYRYTAANKIESRIQVAREYPSESLRNLYFKYDANNRLDKVINKQQATSGPEYVTDSICLHYNASGQLSYAINYKASSTDSIVYSNFHKTIPMSSITYKKEMGGSTYELNFKLRQEFDQYDNLLKSTSESFDPMFNSKRETTATYEPYSEQTILILKNTNAKSDYFSFANSMWVNEGFGTFSHFQKGRVVTDYTRNCAENFATTLLYESNGFIKSATSKGTSSCYDGNNFDETYSYKDLIIYEPL